MEVKSSQLNWGVLNGLHQTFEIERTLSELSESAKGWKKELNLVSWNGRPGKFDIREWDPNHEKMGKGITLSKEEVIALRDILNKVNLD